jgi:predicted ArsR family transcriptional regulator
VVDAADRVLTPVRADLLGRLTAGTARTVADLAAQTGQHQNTVREQLAALVRAGLADHTHGVANGRGRPARTYVALPGGVPSGRARDYAGLAAALVGQMIRTSADPSADARAAGEAWGQGLAGMPPPRRERAPATARRRVVELLNDLGFAPRANPAATTMRLTRCPLLDLARRHPDVVCAVHLGIATGILRTLGGNAERATIHPFAEPGACRLDLLTHRT